MAKLIGYLLQRVARFRGHEPLRRRPGSKVAHQMIEIPICLHLEFWRIDLLKREEEVGELLNEPAFLRPESTDHLVIVSINNLIDRSLDVRQAISRRRKD